MPTTLQFRRGTAAQNDAYTGASGEITVDTTNKTLRVHDGSTAGGTRLGKYTEVEAVDSAVVTSIIDSAIGSTIQALLVSGTNIKTINSQSLLGSGNITITGGDGSGTLDSTTVLDVIDTAYIQANQITYSTADFPDSAGVIALISANETTYTNVSEFVNDANYLDSTTVQDVIDATYVQANQTTYSTADFLDSYYATALIDSAYVQARQAPGAGTDPIFKTISVSGQSNVVADTTADTLTFVAGTGISITTDADADEITFTATGGGGSGTLDSTTVLDVINATYIQANQTTYTNVSEFTNDANYLDSTTVQGVVNSAYVNGLVDSVSNATNALTLNSQAASYYLDYNNFSNTPTIPTNNNELTNGAGYITSSALSSYATQSYVTTEINNLIDGAPDTLNTLNEIAAALNDDDSAYATLVTLIGTKTSYDSTNAAGQIEAYGYTTYDSSNFNQQLGAASGVSFDPAGTDNSTDVTLNTSSYDYLSLSGQQITLGQIDAATDITGLATVATTGTYADLSGTPTNVSTFTNDANYLDSTTVQDVIDTAYVQANQITYSTADFPDSAGVTSLANAAISSAVGSTVQAQLVSGTNIKTVNSQSLLGSGNLSISGGSGTLDSSTALGVIDDHLNTGTAGTGEVLSWTGSDYDWVAQSGGAGGGIAYDDSAQDQSTGWFGLPVGTTDQRDSAAVPADGAIRVNSTTDFLEAYYEGAWIDVKNLAVASATGGTVTEVDGYKYHAFTTGGTFEVTSWPGGTTADIIIVGGGGGGAGGNNAYGSGGGGGAGGVILLTSQTLSVTSYSITIGSGGAGASGLDTAGGTGGDTTAFSNTAYGGGGGGCFTKAPTSGASGGGAGTGQDAGKQTGASSSYPAQGNDGGDAEGTAGNSTSCGGGGGAGAVGGDAVSGTAGNGGAGYDASAYFASFGESGYFGGGGGGGRAFGDGGGAGGTGGGGAAGVASGNGSDGTANTGGGGGGGAATTSEVSGGSGGSGIVVIRYAVV